MLVCGSNFGDKVLLSDGEYGIIQKVRSIHMIRLTEMRINVPCAYKREQGVEGFETRRKGKNAACDYKWSYTTI